MDSRQQFIEFLMKRIDSYVGELGKVDSIEVAKAIARDMKIHTAELGTLLKPDAQRG